MTHNDLNAHCFVGSFSVSAPRLRNKDRSAVAHVFAASASSRTKTSISPSDVVIVPVQPLQGMGSEVDEVTEGSPEDYASFYADRFRNSAGVPVVLVVAEGGTPIDEQHIARAASRFLRDARRPYFRFF